MNPKALDIIKQYHDKILLYAKDGDGSRFTFGEIQNLSIAKGLIDGNPFSTCCSGPINKGMKEVKNYYLNYLNANP